MKKEQKKIISECPVSYPEGSWMGNHHYVFRPGTRVEEGLDAKYLCAYCGKEYKEEENENKES